MIYYPSMKMHDHAHLLGFGVRLGQESGVSPARYAEDREAFQTLPWANYDERWKFP